MNLEVDKLLWCKFDSLEKFTNDNIDFYTSFQKILEHHRNSISQFIKNLITEVNMTTKLQNKLGKKQHFVMFRNLLSFFKSNFKHYYEKWSQRLKIFDHQIYDPLERQFSKSGKLVHMLKQSQKAYVKLRGHLDSIEASQGNYYSSWRNFQGLFLEQKVIEDISSFSKPSKNKYSNLKQGIRKARDKLSSAKSKYEECLKGYNNKATQIINRNSYAIKSSVDFIIQSGILIKNSFEGYLTELCKVTKSKVDVDIKGDNARRMSYRANLTEFDKIDPTLEVYSWVISHTATEKCPPKILKLQEYQSFFANGMMVKRFPPLNNSFINLINEVYSKIWKDPSIYDDLRKDEKEKKLQIEEISRERTEVIDLSQSQLPQTNNPFRSDVGYQILGKDVEKGVRSLLNKQKKSATIYLNRLCSATSMLVNAWKGRGPSAQDLDHFITYIKNSEILLSFPHILEAFRKLKEFEINKSGFKTVVELIMIMLTECSNTFNVVVPLGLINMAGTYYKIVSGNKKVYIMDGIKNHKLYQNRDFWEACLLWKITSSKEGYDFHDVRFSVESHVVQDGFIDQLVGCFLTIAMHMQEFGRKKETVFEIIKEYIKKYRLPSRKAESIFDYLKVTFADAE